jgi:hypothetical protein
MKAIGASPTEGDDLSPPVSPEQKVLTPENGLETPVIRMDEIEPPLDAPMETAGAIDVAALRIEDDVPVPHPVDTFSHRHPRSGGTIQ